MSRRGVRAAFVAAWLGVAATVPAQAAEEEPLPARVPAGLEIGAGGGAVVAYPELTVLVSAPIGPNASVEVMGGWMPRIVYEVEHALLQAQVRLPFRPHLRARRSLVAGVTRISARKRSRFDSGFWGDDATVVFPHAGASLQWPLGRRTDVRLDAQGLFTLDGELPLVGRVVGTIVWRSRRKP